ncbi:hypothetical protein M9435_004878 [Picochlorum sp. BPE23]|nr:hypothetical protein M9435_004878 [Picochlorum sp. BPE23]
MVKILKPVKARPQKPFLLIFILLLVPSVLILFRLETLKDVYEIQGDGSDSSGDAAVQKTRSHKLGGRSDAWLPIVVADCDGLDPRSAPCLKARNKVSNMISAHELVYRPFKLAIPGFINETQKEKWVEAVMHDAGLQNRMMLRVDEGKAVYPAQFGQNLVFENAQYTGIPPPDLWREDSCMGGGAASHKQFLNPVNVSEIGDAYEALVIATVPDSWSWQHFLDRVTVIWSQAMLGAEDSFKGDNITIVSGREPQQRVNELYEIMRVKHVHRVSRAVAKKVVFSCRAPLIHPFTSQRFNDLIGWRPTPLKDRNVVLMMPRSHSRQIMNQDELNNRVEALLRMRGKDEVFQVFDQDQFADMVDIITFMRDRVKMVIGPHGGAMYNIRFASPAAALLEFMPTQRFQPVFWETARLFEHHYYFYFCESLNAQHNMVIENLNEVVGWIDDILNAQEHSQLPAVEPQYDWQV